VSKALHNPGIDFSLRANEKFIPQISNTLWSNEAWALLNRGMNFCLRGVLRAPLKQKFIPEISNA
jgi:hypothetical protein